jgi:hypothetical protein
MGRKILCLKGWFFWCDFVNICVWLWSKRCPVVMVLMLQVCTIGAPEVILCLENVINMNHLVDIAIVYMQIRVIYLPEKMIFLYIF